MGIIIITETEGEFVDGPKTGKEQEPKVGRLDRGDVQAETV